MNFTQFYKSHRSTLWKAILVFKLVSGFLFVADQLSIRYGLDGSQRVVDDLLGAIRRTLELAFLNHHIRNALQPLTFMIDEPESRERMKLVDECVRRIDWALREVLPGNSEEQAVTHDAGFVRNTGASAPSRAPSSSNTQNSGPKPTTRQPKPLFIQWIDTWKSRNERAS